MTQRTRNIIANFLIGMCILCVVAFVVEHFMTSPHPSWHRDLPWLALAFVIGGEALRGRMRHRRPMKDVD